MAANNFAAALPLASDTKPSALARDYSSSGGAPFRYEFTRRATTPWKVCAILPNQRDSYWTEVEESLNHWARATGINLRIIFSSAYGRLRQQQTIIQQRCLEAGFQALLLGAIDATNLSNSITEAAAHSVPVIDLINGYEHPAIQAHARVDYGEMAYAIGNHLVDSNEPKKRPIQVLWIPGPKGPKWVADGDAGMQRLADQGKVTIVDRLYLEPFFRTQQRELQKWLTENSGTKVDYIVGTAPTAEAAMYLRETLKQRNIRVAAYYINPRIISAVRCGDIVAAAYDSPGILARIAVDMAIKILEKKTYRVDAGPLVQVITPENAEQVLAKHLTLQELNCVTPPETP